jgi:serine O-acetyltransferase
MERSALELINHTRASLIDYVCAQVGTFFPDGADVRTAITRNFTETMGRVERCINAIRVWPHDKFNYLHSAQYCLFLYFLANTIWRNDSDAGTATRLFLLNKALNGIDMFYEIAMPDIFVLGHSTGIVLAKATYGNYLVLHQNCTVGRNREAAPVIGEGVVMYPGTSIIGRSHIGSFSALSIGTQVVNRDTPGDCTVFGAEGGDLAFKPRSHRYAEEIFDL